MNSNFWTVVFVFGIFTLFTQVSLSLGLTTTILENPDAPNLEGDITLIDGLTWGFRFAINNIGSMFQIITFQTSLPIFWSLTLIAPIGVGFFYLGFIMIRGGAN